MSSYPTTHPSAAYSKKSGRPPQDECSNPIEQRRRLQLRAAQRTYRMRKSNTLELLKSQNAALEAKIEAMSKVFVHLADTAIDIALESSQTATVIQVKSCMKEFLGILDSNGTGNLTEVNERSPWSFEGDLEKPSADEILICPGQTLLPEDFQLDIPLPLIDLEHTMPSLVAASRIRDHSFQIQTLDLSSTVTSQNLHLPFGYPATPKTYFLPEYWSFVAELLWNTLTRVYRSFDNDPINLLVNTFRVFNECPPNRTLDRLFLRWTMIMQAISVEQQASDGPYIDLGCGPMCSANAGQRIYYGTLKLLTIATELDRKLTRPSEYMSIIQVYQYLLERGAFNYAEQRSTLLHAHPGRRTVRHADLPRGSDRTQTYLQHGRQTIMYHKSCATPDWKTVQISIPTLIDELSKRMVCVDESPNFSVASIDASIEKAIIGAA